MLIKVLFFGLLKDVAGCAEEELSFPGGDLQALFDHYASQHPRLKALEGSIVLARNQRFCSRSEVLTDGDEVAFLPPVSGGSLAYSHEITDPEGHFFALTRESIEARDLAHRLLRDEDGAIVEFRGTVRNNTKGRSTLFLDYECYEAMAIKVMAETGRAIAAEHAIGRIGIVHRLGRMEIGETSVIVLVTAPHRGPAFEAAKAGIDRLKRLVPIWKKEHFADGEVWVEGQWDDQVL